jgi:F0F1-type ATP synthase assembly protein I
MRLDPQTLQAIQLVSGLGCSIAVCLGGGILAGFWADQRLHTKPWFVLAGILLGLVGSGAIIYNLMKTASKQTKQDDHSENSKPDGSA